MEGWLARFVQGDRSVWADVYERYKREVLGLCLGFLKDPDEALDAAEEAFMKAFSRAERVNPNGNFRAWLLTIAANTCKDLLRKRARGRAWLRAWWAGRREQADPLQRSAHEQVAEQERQDRVRQALLRLEERYRLPLVLRFYADLDYDEIARILSELEGRPLERGTVASRLHRAKSRLKELLDETA